MMAFMAVLVLVVGCVLPFSGIDIGGWPSFLPVTLALAYAFDLLSAVLLVRQFHDTGDRRAIVLASSFIFSLVVLTGYAAAFPGIVGDVGPLGTWPSTAPWLWLAWHTGFPVLVAAAVGPWPNRWKGCVSAPVRRTTAWATIAATAGAGTLVVVAAVTGRGWLPVLITGLDLSALTRVAGPVAV